MSIPVCSSQIIHTFSQTVPRLILVVGLSDQNNQIEHNKAVSHSNALCNPGLKMDSETHIQ